MAVMTTTRGTPDVFLGGGLSTFFSPRVLENFGENYIRHEDDVFCFVRGGGGWCLEKAYVFFGDPGGEKGER